MAWGDIGSWSYELRIDRKRRELQQFNALASKARAAAISGDPAAIDATRQEAAKLAKPVGAAEEYRAKIRRQFAQSWGGNKDAEEPDKPRTLGEYRDRMGSGEENDGLLGDLKDAGRTLKRAGADFIESPLRNVRGDTDLLEPLERRGGLLGNVAAGATDAVTSPASLLTLGLGAPASGALRAGTAGTRFALAGRGAANVIEPVAAGSVGRRVAAEAAFGGAAQGAATEVAERLPEDTPGPLGAAATLGAGLLAGGATAHALNGPEAARAALREQVRKRLMVEEIDPATGKARMTPKLGLMTHNVGPDEMLMHGTNRPHEGPLRPSEGGDLFQGGYVTAIPRWADYWAERAGVPGRGGVPGVAPDPEGQAVRLLRPTSRLRLLDPNHYMTPEEIEQVRRALRSEVDDFDRRWEEAFDFVVRGQQLPAPTGKLIVDVIRRVRGLPLPELVNAEGFPTKRMPPEVQDVLERAGWRGFSEDPANPQTSAQASIWNPERDLTDWFTPDNPRFGDSAIEYHGAGFDPRTVGQTLTAAGPVARNVVAPGGNFDLKNLEPTGMVARLYGQLPFLREKGFGRMPDFMVDAPDAYSADTLINLREGLEQAKLPASARVSNAFWKGLAATAGDRFLTKLDDPAVRQIAVAWRTNEGQIREVADVVAEMAARPALQPLQTDELGQALIDGATVNIRNEKGVPLPPKATWVDVFEHPDRYPDVLAKLPPEQVDALRALSARLSEITETSKAMGITVEGAANISGEGFYLPRGRPKPRVREEAPSTFTGQAKPGRKAGSTQERKYASQGEGIAKGEAYPDHIEAVREFVTENLRQQNAWHAATMLKRLEVDAHLVGEAQVPETVKREAQALTKEINPLRREARDLRTRQARVERDARLNDRWLTGAKKRIDDLQVQAQKADIEGQAREGMAREAFDTAKQALKDALGMADDLRRATGKVVSDRDSQRAAYNQLLAEAGALSKRLSAIEDEIAAGPPGPIPSNAFFQEAQGAWMKADALRKRAVEEAARIERRLAELPADDVREGLREADELVTDIRERFGEATRTAKAAADQMAAAELREGKAVANAREALATGRVRELAREVERRAASVKRAHGVDSELAAKIDELKARMDPLVERRRELAAQIKEARALAHFRGEKYAAEVNLEPMRGLKVPASLANAFNKYIAEQGQPGQFTAVFDTLNAIYRSLGATADASRQMTVGLLGMADNPKLAGRAVAAGVKAARDPQSIWDELARIEAENVAKGLPRLDEAVGKDGLQIAASEMSLSGGVERSNDLLSRISRLPIIRQADALYSAPANLERVGRYYKVLADRKAAGLDYTSPGARQAAAAAANLTSGRARRGVLSPFAGEEVSGRLAFAGRFVQSQFETVANAALVSGIEGDEARRALLRLVVGGAAMTYVINELLGNDTDWRPVVDNGFGPQFNSNFMRIRVAGRDVSLFGPWDSLVRGVIVTAQGNPEQFVRSKLAPLPALGWDFSVGGGKNPVGEDLGVKQLLPMPFSGRAIAETAMSSDLRDPTSLGALMLTVPMDLLGVKNSAVTVREQLDEASQARFRADFYDLSASQKQTIKDENPKLWKASVDAGDEKKQRAYEVTTKLRSQQEASDAKFLAGQMTREQWESQFQARRSELRIRLNEVYGDTPIVDPKTPVERYVQQLQQNTDAATGEVDWDAVDAWRAGISPADDAYITENTGLSDTKLVRTVRQKTREYYELPRYRGLTADEGRQVEEVMVLVNQLVPSRSGRQRSDVQQLRALSRLAAEMKLDPKVLRGARAQILGQLKTDTARERWRVQNPGYAPFVTGQGPLTPAERAAVQKALAA